MTKLNDYIVNPAICNAALSAILEKIGGLEVSRLSFASLLMIHAMISEANAEQDKNVFKLLDVIHLHVLERLAFVPNGADVGQYLYEEENVGLTLKHLFYAKRMLLGDFELRLRDEGRQKLNLLYRLVYDRCINLFVLLSHFCMKSSKDIEEYSFSMADLEFTLQAKEDVNFIYFKELKERLISELQQLKFLKRLSTQGVWQGIRTVLNMLKEQKQPFGEFQLDKVYH